MDAFTKSERSRIMATVRGKNVRSTERRLRAALVGAGMRGWSYQRADLTGKPDFVFLQTRLVVFVYGCFWHGYPKCYRRPHSRRSYWDGKVAGNTMRDRKVSRILRNEGWRVLRIWEHELTKSPERCARKIQKLLLA